MSAPRAGWIGVDLDGTLAHYEGWKGPQHIGEPIPAMLERVKGWIAADIEVRIFTARVCSFRRDIDEVNEVRVAIENWCRKHLGQALEVTNQKDFDMIELWDDRCVQVEVNTGRQLSPGRGGAS